MKLMKQKRKSPVLIVRKKKKQQKSLMPEPITAGITEQNLADIVAFLLSSKLTDK